MMVPFQASCKNYLLNIETKTFMYPLPQRNKFRPFRRITVIKYVHMEPKSFSCPNNNSELRIPSHAMTRADASKQE